MKKECSDKGRMRGFGTCPRPLVLLPEFPRERLMRNFRPRTTLNHLPVILGKLAAQRGGLRVILAKARDDVVPRPLFNVATPGL